jgi:hypothetical protein
MVDLVGFGFVLARVHEDILISDLAGKVGLQ